MEKNEKKKLKQWRVWFMILIKNEIQFYKTFFGVTYAYFCVIYPIYV